MTSYSDLLKRMAEDNLKALNSIDWDFAGFWTKYGLNLAHWYPTKLAPQIAAVLLSRLTSREDLVLDPFCGSGTVLGEAMRLGRRSIGVDISPIACMISKVRSTLIPLAELRRSIDRMKHALDFGLKVMDHQILPLPASEDEERAFIVTKSMADWLESVNHELNKWFEPTVLRDLIFASKWINMESNSAIREFLSVCHSSILKASSSQRKSWGYIADNVIPKRHIRRDVQKLMNKQLEIMWRGMQLAFEQCARLGLTIEELNALAIVKEGDARKLDFIPNESVGCIITSPPYANVSDSVKAQRLSVLWFGYNIDEIKHKEIGARWKRFRKTALSDYLFEMTECIGELHRVLRNGGYLGMVLGSSPKWEEEMPTSQSIHNILVGQFHFVCEGEYTRSIAGGRQHGSASVMKETILIYRKI